MRLILTNQSGSFDVTELTTSVQWAGSCTQCARTLSLGLLGEGAPNCALGCHLSMSEGGSTLFTGIVLSRTKSTADPVIELTAFDYGIYLRQNRASRKYTGTTPEAATAALCGDFGIKVGTAAATGIAVSRKFFGKSLYEIIMSLYTEAAKSTGKAYFVSFAGDVLHVREKGAAGQILLITGGSNLIDASTTESAERLVNRVSVYDQNETLLYGREDSESTALYGVMQTVLKQKNGADSAAEVSELLRGARPEQKISVNCCGDVSCQAGGSVMLQEPFTGLCGRFYIDSDSHQWKNGVYTNKLILNLKAVMDEKTAGEEIRASNESGASKASGYQKQLEKIQKQTKEGKG